MSDTKYAHINFPRKLLERLDELYSARYRNRSDAVIDAVRKLVRELEEA